MVEANSDAPEKRNANIGKHKHGVFFTEREILNQIAKECGADFVKTSTGFSTGGATEHDVKLMREAVGKEMGVKASGGIKTYEDALKMIEAGANRLGTSSGIAIVKSSM